MEIINVLQGFDLSKEYFAIQRYYSNDLFFSASGKKFDNLEKIPSEKIFRKNIVNIGTIEFLHS
jgi:hypothetical protein